MVRLTPSFLATVEAVAAVRMTAPMARLMLAAEQPGKGTTAGKAFPMAVAGTLLAVAVAGQALRELTLAISLAATVALEFNPQYQARQHIAAAAGADMCVGQPRRARAV